MDPGWTGAFFYRARNRLARGDAVGARADFALLAGLQNAPHIARFGEAASAVVAGDSVPLRAFLSDAAAGRLEASWLPMLGYALLGQWDDALDWWERTVPLQSPLAIHSLQWWPASRMRGYARYERILGDRWRVPAGIRR